MNEEEKKAPACVPYFAHEGMLEHFNRVNKRMLIADNTAQTQYIVNRVAPYPIPSYTVTNPATPAT